MKQAVDDCQAYTAQQYLFFLVYFPGLRKNPKSDGSMEYIFFFGLPLFISRAAEKKSKSILLISCFSPEKVQNYTILSHFWSFSLFFLDLPLFISGGPGKIQNPRRFLGQLFFLDCHYLFPAGSAKSKKKSN